MATMSFDGADDLIQSIQELTEMPESVLDDMLQAQAAVTIPAIQAKGRAYGVVDTGQSLASLKPGKPKWNRDRTARELYISPTGFRRRGRTVTRNAEILFVNEYGKRGQKARPFMKDGGEAAAESQEKAAMTVYNGYLNQKDL